MMRLTLLLPIMLLTLFAVLSPTTGSGLAQTSLFGQLQQQAQPPQPAPQSRPAQSLPRVAFDPSSVPAPEAYGRLGAEATSDAPRFDAALTTVTLFRQRLLSTFLRAPDAFDEVFTTLEAASRTGRPSYFAGIAMFALLLLAVGRAVALLGTLYLMRPWFVGLQRPDPQGYREKLPVLATRVIFTILGTVVTIGTASAVGLVYSDGHQARLTTVFLIFGVYGGVIVLDTVWRMALCPFLPAYRLPHLSGPQARTLYRWLTVMSAFTVVAVGFSQWMRALGLPGEVLILLTLALATAIVLTLMVLIRTNAAAIDTMILAGQPRSRVTWLTGLTRRLWAPLLVLYLIGIWARLSFNLVMGVPEGLEALAIPFAILIGGLVVYAFTAYAIERVFSRSRDVTAINRAARERRSEESVLDQTRMRDEMRDDAFGSAADTDGDGEDEASSIRALEPATEPGPTRPRPGMKTFEDLARRVASLLAIGAGAWLLIYSWAGRAVFEDNRLIDIAESTLDILFIGYITFHAARIWMDQKIAEEVGDEDPSLLPMEGEGGGVGATRLATLLPLIRNFVLSVIGIAIALVVATDLGVNVGPLFAGAGIVGLAIGFGSQTLVRDILSGAFFLMDDAFRKGEYIDVGAVKGTVEKISLRSFQLRHHLGMLHTIPFGEITHLTNFSRDWVMMKLPLRLTYDTDVDAVRKMIKKLGIALLDDPEIGTKFLQPLKSQGVIQMEDSAMIVRVKFMCRPGEQWVIRKRVFQEIRTLFEREGIKFAHREVTVRIPETANGRALTDLEKESAGAAARASIDVAEAAARLRPAAVGGDDR